MVYKNKMTNKRGQFYLIAAVVIISIIIGFIGIQNYSQRTSFEEIYNLGEELKIESEKVIDYGVYNKIEEQGLYDTLYNFTRIYAKYRGDGRELYFVFGNANSIVYAEYKGEQYPESEEVTEWTQTASEDLNIESGVSLNLPSKANKKVTDIVSSVKTKKDKGYEAVIIEFNEIADEINYQEGEGTITEQEVRDEIVIVVGDFEYKVKIRKQGEFFYFVILQKIYGEHYIVTS